MAFQHTEPESHAGPGVRYFPDLGFWHVAAWRRRRTLAAMDAANAALAEALRDGSYFRRPIEERAP